MTAYPQRTPATWRWLALIAWSAAISLCGGCGGPGGQLALRSQTDRSVTLQSDFTTGIYRMDDRSNLTMLLVDGPLEAPRRAVTIRLQWRPRAARTPIDPDATNATMRCLVFTGPNREELGIYSGAGFVYPEQTPGKATFKAKVWQAHLRPTDKTAGFVDQLGQAGMQGQFTARRDDEGMELALRQLNIQVRERLGYPRLVRND